MIDTLITVAVISLLVLLVYVATIDD